MTTQVSCQLRGKPFTLKNPVLPGAGSYGNVVEYADIVDLSALGALVPNSLMIKGGGPNRVNKFFRTPYGYLSSFGANNISLQSFIDDALPKLPRDTPVIVDLKAANVEDMEAMAALAAKTEGIAAVEVNLIWPYGTDDAPYWEDSETLHRNLKRVVAAAGDKPVIAGAPGGSFDMEEMARVLESAGVDMFVCFNNVFGCAVDVRSRTVQGGGYFGPGIKPYALARCWDAVDAFNIPVIAGGGVTCAEDVLEYIMLGAFAVRVGSANLTRPDFMQNLVGDLAALMAELGIESLDEVRGCAKSVSVDLF